MDSGEGGPYLCSDQEENFKQEDAADDPRSLMSCLAELVICYGEAHATRIYK